MRKVQISATGPLGWSDWMETFSEDTLLLTASGEVKAAHRLREGDVLIRFGEFSTTSALRFSITKIEWLRREVHV